MLACRTHSQDGAVIALGLILSATVVGAQTGLTGGAIAGTIRDASGTPLAAAAVTATELSTNLTRTTTADQRGRYVLAALPLGAYRVQAEHLGFQPLSRTGVAPAVGQALILWT